MNVLCGRSNLPQHNVKITKYGQLILNIICLICLIVWYVWYVTEHGQFWPIRPIKKLGPPKNSPPQTAFWSQPLLHQEFRFVPGPGSIEDLGWVKNPQMPMADMALNDGWISSIFRFFCCIFKGCQTHPWSSSGTGDWSLRRRIQDRTANQFY